VYSYCFLALFLKNGAKVKKSFASAYKEVVELVIKVSFNVEIAKYVEERITEI